MSRVIANLMAILFEKWPEHTLTLAADGHEAWVLLSDPEKTFRCGVSRHQHAPPDGLSAQKPPHRNVSRGRSAAPRPHGRRGEASGCVFSGHFSKQNGHQVAITRLIVARRIFMAKVARTP